MGSLPATTFPFQRDGGSNSVQRMPNVIVLDLWAIEVWGQKCQPANLYKL